MRSKRGTGKEALGELNARESAGREPRRWRSGGRRPGRTENRGDSAPRGDGRRAEVATSKRGLAAPLRRASAGLRALPAPGSRSDET